MSDLSNIPPVAYQISLVLHTAVDFGLKPGIGIGIIQRAVTSAARTSTLPTEEHKHGIEHHQARAANVKTRERAHMFALMLAMGMTCSTLRRGNKVQSVTVLCSLPAVVELIAYHRAHGPRSLESVASVEDRAMIKRVLASVKRLARYGVQVSIVGDGEEGDTVEAERVKMIAHHRKKKACRRRRHERRLLSRNFATADGGGEGEDRVGDGEEGGRDISYSGPMIERESSSTLTIHETSKPAFHWTRLLTHSSFCYFKAAN